MFNVFKAAVSALLCMSFRCDVLRAELCLYFGFALFDMYDVFLLLL